MWSAFDVGYFYAGSLGGFVNLDIDPITSELHWVDFKSNTRGRTQCLAGSNTESPLVGRAFNNVLIEVSSEEVRTLVRATAICREVTRRDSIKNNSSTRYRYSGHRPLRRVVIK